MVELYPGLAAHVWSQQSATAMASFLGSWIKSHGFDGIYLDGYLEPDLVQRSILSFYAQNPTRQYDVDGDGRADSVHTASGQYFAWSAAFVAMLRSRLAPGAIMLANRWLCALLVAVLVAVLVVQCPCLQCCCPLTCLALAVARRLRRLVWYCMAAVALSPTPT
jgi:hypothetical protein